ncbi:MAG: glycosyltransferase family 2 protein [candidate division WOR-3 bacterium]
MNNPVVSVIIPLYNKERFVPRAIDSVLGQSFQKFEIIVVDDCSTDKGPEKIRKFADPRIRLLRTKRNSGPGLARDLGIKASVGELVAFLDADDEWKPQFLERCVRFIRVHPEAGLVATGYEIYRKGSHEKVVLDVPEGIVNPFVLWLRASFAWTSGITMKKESYITVGGFEYGLRQGEDVNLWFKVAMKYPIGYIPEALAIYHLDAGERITSRWFLGRPAPWIFSEEFMPVSEEFKKSPFYDSFLRIKKQDADRYLRKWLAFWRFHHAWKFARKHGLSYCRPLIQEIPYLPRNAIIIAISLLKLMIRRLIG